MPCQPSQRSVIQKDIEHYREMLKITPDPAKRRQIENYFSNKKPSSRNTTKTTKGNNAFLGRLEARLLSSNQSA